MRPQRIRFAPVVHWELDLPVASEENALPAAPNKSSSSLSSSKTSVHRKSKICVTGKTRSGCRECKRRRVKCDETFPVCLRCQRSGTVCRALPRPDQWQFELPGISPVRKGSRIDNHVEVHQVPHVNKILLQGWLQTASRIMVLDHTWNPLSLPLLQYCTISYSLVHVLQSISAGYQEFFQSSRLVLSLEERSKALVALREELETGRQSSISCFFTAYLLGISSTYIDNQVTDYGKEHFLAARQMLKEIISCPEDYAGEMTSFLVGTFVYWYFTCSTLLEPLEGSSAEGDALIYQQVLGMASIRHPITGVCTSLFYLLGNLGRHCRAVVELGIRDIPMEDDFERALLQWQTGLESRFWEITADAFRNYGLIMLYRVCRQHTSDSDSHMLLDAEVERMIREYALRTIHDLVEVPLKSNFMVLQPVPLMTAGAELREEDQELRKLVIARFQALFSYSRLRANLYAINLLEEVWDLKDRGHTKSWLEVMLLKNWRLRLG